MTAYTITGATATANVATDFTPNGIPVYPDTLTIGASKTLIIPAGYTFDAVITAGGASTSARANITVSGTWQLKADQTINGWNNILFNAGAVLDGLSGNGLRFSSATATNAQNKITVSGTEANPVYFTRSDYTTGEPASLISATSTTTSQAGLFDCIYLIVNKMASILYGGASISGNHYKLQNVVLDSCGFFTNVLFVNLASDFVFKNVDYRHTHIADVSNSFPLYIGAESSVGTPTGQRVFDGFTASHNDNTSAKILRFQRINYVNNRTNVVIDNVRVDFSTTITTANVFDNWSFRSNFASNNCLFLSDAVQNSMFIMDGTDNIGTGNFHLFDARIVSTLDSCFIEGIVQSGSITDGSDWFMVPLTGTVNVKNNILIDEKGGVFVNNLGAVGAGLSPSTANVTIEHNTVINKKATATFANPYGTLFRTETNGYYSSGTVSIKSNLNVVLDNLSSDGQVAAMLLVSVTGLGGTIPTDQIDVMDYNNYYNLVTSPPTNLFRNVTTTGKTYGDDGFGMHDKYIAPLFTNYPSRSDRSVILDFATSKGLTSTGQIFTELLKLNGFNETTRKQSASSVSAFNRLDIWNYAKNAVTPSNAVLSTSAHDGTAIGAVQFTIDTTPDAFTFGSTTGANPSTVTTSSTRVTVSGVTASVDIAAVPTGGIEYRVSTDGGTSFGAWTGADSNVQLGFVIEARVTSSSSFSTLVTGTLTIGGVAGTLQVTTRAADTVPNAFSFGALPNVDPSAVTVSPTQVTVAGVDAGIDIAAVPTGGLGYRVSTDGGGTFGSWLTTTSNVQLGYVIEARVTASAGYNTLVTGTLTIGGVAGTLQVTTKASSSAPDSFSFASVSGVTPTAVIASPTTVTVSGVSAGVDVAASVSGGLEYRVDSGGGYAAWRVTGSNVRLGYHIQVRLAAPSTISTSATGTFTMGGVSGTFTVTAGGGARGDSSALSMTQLIMEQF